MTLSAARLRLTPKKSLTLLGAAALLTVALPSSAAHAASGLDGCESGWACGFASTGFSGGPAMFQQTNDTFTIFTSKQNGVTFCIPGNSAAKDDTNDSWNDCISSVVDNMAASITWYENINCASGGGTSLNIDQGTTVDNLTALNLNDVFSSDFVGGDGGSCS
jgi:hypothetical protein